MNEKVNQVNISKFSEVSELGFLFPGEPIFKQKKTYFSWKYKYKSCKAEITAFVVYCMFIQKNLAKKCEVQ